MRILYLGLVYFLLVSCQEKARNSTSFDLIDVSIYNGWTDYYCVKVYQDGKTYIYNNHFKKGETYYSVNIGKSEIDTISAMVTKILASKIDTLYERDCADCGAFNLIINTKTRKFKSLVVGWESNKEGVCMNQLLGYLGKIIDTSKKAIDSSFKFESRTIQFYPPPPPPKINE